MILKQFPVAFTTVLLWSSPLVQSISSGEIPVDTPVAQLLSYATSSLAQGNPQDALVYFDAAVAKDPQNYLTLFKRGAAHLSLGRNQQASQDFDRALAIRPTFEGALLQRAKIKSRNGDWAAAKKDYLAAGKKGEPELAALNEAQGAAVLAEKAEKSASWDECISNASLALMIAGANVDIRQMRARCRFAKGEVMEGVSDLQHVVQLAPGSTRPHLEISAMSYYSLGETEKGMSAIRKCLQSDPDSKACRSMLRREKQLDKDIKRVKSLMDKGQFATAVKLLVPSASGDSHGLIKDVEEDIRQHREDGIVHEKAPDGLYQQLVEMACEAYFEMDSPKKAKPYCDTAMMHNPHSLPALLLKATQQIASDDFESATRTLNLAHEHHPQSQKAQELLQKAQMLLRRSQQKDYYKVLGVDRDADERQIKKAYRKLSGTYHPDKASSQGLTKEEAEKKMAAINEAYEVLSDPELKARFDRGDDPNSPQGQQGPFGQGGHPFGGGGRQFVFQQGGPSFHFGQGPFGQGGGFPGGGFPFGF